jgi:prepilin-type processing-associated H-X9-DG protein
MKDATLSGGFMMLKNFTSLRLVAWFAVAAFPVLAQAQVLADKVPADTILYVGWRGTESPGPGFEGSHLQAFLADSNIPAVAKEFLPQLLDRIAKEDRDAAEGIEIARTFLEPLLRHPTAIAFAGVEMKPQGPPRPKLVLLCQAGNESAALKAKISGLLEKAGPPPFPVHVTDANGMLAFVIGYDKVEDAISAAGGKSLANNVDFVKSLAQVNKDAYLTGYVDVEKILALVETGMAMAPPEIGKNWAPIRDKLGLRGIKRLIVTEGFDGKDWASRVFVAAPAPREGLLGALLEGQPLSQQILGTIPENAAVAGASHFDLGGLVTMIRTAVTTFQPEAAAKIDQAIAQANQMVGFDIQKDLLGSLGNEWAYYNDASVAGNGVVGTILVNHLKDPAKAEASLTKLETFLNQLIAAQTAKEKNGPIISLKQVKIGDATVHYLAVPLVCPSWSVQHGNLYFGLYPEIVGAAIRHVPGQSKSIASNPAFHALLVRIGEHPLSSFGFVDVPRLAPENYSTWLVISHLTHAGDLFGVPAPMIILPPLAKLLPHLSPAGEFAWTDADGLHVSALEAFPASQIFGASPSSMAVGEMALVTSIMLPALNKVRGEAQHAKSSANLRQIGAAAITYANIHNGKYPKDLGEMLAETGYPADIVVNPASNKVAPRLQPKEMVEWVAEHADYVWNGAGKNSSAFGPNDPLAWEKPEQSRGRVNILFGDLHVQAYPVPEAMQMIEKAKAAK